MKNIIDPVPLTPLVIHSNIVNFQRTNRQRFNISQLLALYIFLYWHQCFKGLQKRQCFQRQCFKLVFQRLSLSPLLFKLAMSIYAIYKLFPFIGEIANKVVIYFKAKPNISVCSLVNKRKRLRSNFCHGGSKFETSPQGKLATRSKGLKHWTTVVPFTSRLPDSTISVHDNVSFWVCFSPLF